MRDELISVKSFEIEKPNQNCAVEWWFFFGSFSSPSISERNFMVSFFRHNIFDENGKFTNAAYSLLCSILNPETGENKTTSMVNKDVVDRVLELLEEKSKLELDPDFFAVLKKELKQHGPPIPIRLGTTSSGKSGETLDINWGNFSLFQNEANFEIKIPLYEENKSVSLNLYPLTERFEFIAGNISNTNSGEMVYRCYPQLELKGNINGEELTGQAWMDHQWGDTSWFISETDDKSVLGWDWFGINLDDGSNIIIVVHKYAKTNEIIHIRSVWMKSKEKSIFLKDVKTSPKRFWESPVTHIEYPVEWSIDIADLDLSLDFIPTVDDQELHVLGTARAIWEGAGTVNGVMKGKTISGKARGEFFGYGYIFDFQNYLKNLADRVDKRIEEFLPKVISEKVIQQYVGKPYWKNEPKAYTEMISKPVWDLILRRGKRWRPIFGILMQEALGQSSVNYERSCCLSELIHSGALIIDDIEDNSELRRGEPALHIKYGLDVALNAGNTLYFLPTVELFYHEHLNEKEKLRIHEIMMNTYLQAHFGQTLDIYWSKYMNLENLAIWLEDDIESKILQMYDYKTAAGPKGLAEIAAVLSGVDDKITQTAISFARAFAVAFQIIDDVHNFSNSPRWTKVPGEDIKNGKLTFAIAKAIKSLSKEEGNRLKQILCDEKLRKEKETLNEGIELVRNSGALEECKKEAKEMSMKAWDNFAEIVPSRESKIMLNMLCLKMLDLAYDT